MSGTDFTIAWVHGEMRAARLNRGVIVDTWNAAEPVEDLRSFEEGFHEASMALGMRYGLDVAVLYEGPELHHIFLETPAMPANDLTAFLKRKVELEAPFKEPASWGYRVSDGVELGNHVMLHVAPRRVIDAIARICGENHVAPRKLLPVTEVIAQHVAHAEVGEDKLLLVAACFTDVTMLAVARGNGQIVLVRELAFGSQDVRRLSGELNRTGLFAKQRLRESIDEVWVIGQDAEHFAAQTQGVLECPVVAITRSTDPDFWITAAANLDQDLTANLIPRATRRTLAGRNLRRLGLWSTAALLLATLTLSLLQHLVIVAAPTFATSAKVEADIGELEQAVHELTLRGEHVQALGERAALLEDAALPMPVWFLEKLVTLVAPGTRFTGAGMELRSDGWRFELAGEASPPLGLAADAVATVVQRLKAPPWNAAISSGWKEQWLEELRAGGAVLDSNKPFRIVGHIQ